jgi:hypothetical protein
MSSKRSKSGKSTIPAHAETEDRQTTIGMHLDTTAGSIIHNLLYPLYRLTFGRIILYLASISLTLVPLVIAASYARALIPSERLTFPLLYDANVIFFFLVSFPCLIILTVSDQQALSRALGCVQSDGAIVVSATDQNEIVARWNARFRIANWAGQALGVTAGGIAAYLNYSLFDPKIPTPHWAINSAYLQPVAYIFYYCLFLFYMVASVYVVRSIVIALLLREVASRAQRIC